jgi:uncharacterized membrane protein YdbT with pleckstrin-like domain
MGYAERVLQPGETIAYRAKLHWIIYLTGLVFLLIAAVAGGFAAAIHDHTVRIGLAVAAVIAFLIALFHLLGAWVRAVSTEIIVTNRRVIYKTGFISRNTVEMNLDKVESVLVRQSLVGRTLNFGSVIVRGVGAGLEPVASISDPLSLHRHIGAPAAA